MMKTILSGVFFLLFMTVVSADTIDWKTADCPTIAYNQKTFEITKIVNNAPIVSLMDGEIVNLTVFREGPPFLIAGRVENGKIPEIECGARTDATLAITIQQQAIERIYVAEDQVKEFLELKNQGAIRVEARSLGSHAKVALAEFTLALYNFFGVKLF